MARSAIAEYDRELVQRWRKTRPKIQRELKAIQRETLDDPMRKIRYCILTPQMTFEKAEKAMAKLTSNSVLRNRERVLAVLQKNGVRFTNKVDWLVKTVGRERELQRLLEETDDYRLRELLRGSFKGIGLKEASHFLRDLGRGERMAILDVWVLRGMKKAGRIDEVPRSLWPAKYYRLEKVYLKWADDLGVPPKHLDRLLHREGESLDDPH